jgi:hypothetical protein
MFFHDGPLRGRLVASLLMPWYRWRGTSIFARNLQKILMPPIFRRNAAWPAKEKRPAQCMRGPFS